MKIQEIATRQQNELIMRRWGQTPYIQAELESCSNKPQEEETHELGENITENGFEDEEEEKAEANQ